MGRVKHLQLIDSLCPTLSPTTQIHIISCFWIVICVLLDTWQNDSDLRMENRQQDKDCYITYPQQSEVDGNMRPDVSATGVTEVSSVSDSMSSSGQVYQVAALISDKALFQVSGGKASHINNLNIIREDKPPQEDNATISCIVDRLHLFRSITDMIRGTILWATRKYQIKCGNFNVQVVIPHPIKRQQTVTIKSQLKALDHIVCTIPRVVVSP
uniref:Uncharacterized protein n=1 Tax=Hyaloperonospora arabidopsidis (strain Emoy2) TaxID=559515 RepID=M4BL85_HYAAE